MAGKDLRVNVIFDAKTKELDKMFKRINKMQSKLNRQAVAQNNITNAVNKTNKSYKKQATLIDGLTTKVHRLANAYLGVLGAKAALTASDTITRAENKLNNINGGNAATTQHQLDQMYTSAQKVRMGYGDMMDNVSKSMMLASGAFGDNIDNAIRFQEVMAEAYSIGGASGAEMHSSMYQMIQGLGSGILQGDELRSVREGAPLAYKAIEEYAQGIYGANENLKDLASQGKITSDIVVAAMLNVGDSMDEAFAKTDMTFAQAWTKMKNTALKSFEPVLQKMNDVLNSDAGRAIIDGIGTGIQVVAYALLTLFTTIERVVTFVQNHSELIKNILLTIATVIVAVLIPKLLLKLWILAQEVILWILVKVEAVASGLAAAAAWAVANWQLALTIAVITAIIIAVIWLSDSFVDACGNVVGAVYWVGAVIYNILAFIINMVTGLVGSIILACENIAYAFYNAWQSAKASFWEWVAECLNGTGLIAKAVSKIASAFGLDAVSIDTKINDARSKLKEYNNSSDFASMFSMVDYVNPNDYFNKGYAKGEQFGNWATDKVNGIGNKISNALNMGGVSNGITPDLNAIKGDTGRIADSMELSEEDLSYLKDVAHREWKKEFTTATIKVDMTNNNTVDKDFDLNSLAIGLRNLVEEEMFAVANGVYA